VKGDVAAFLGLLPLLLLLGRLAIAVVLAAGRLGRWLVEEPRGVRGALVRLIVVAVLLRGMGLL
jgi:hypothetical protein